jgi:ATP-binding cassette subfamily F protein 3
LLILDEPTNHLDIPMREALVDALAAYKGAVIILSHDRALLDAACDRLWVVADGRVKPFDDDLDAYARLVLEARRDSAKREGDASSSQKEERRAAAEKRKISNPCARRRNYWSSRWKSSRRSSPAPMRLWRNQKSSAISR